MGLKLSHTHMVRGVTLVASVLPSAIAIKVKINGQLEIFGKVNGQATIYLRHLY